MANSSTVAKIKSWHCTFLQTTDLLHSCFLIVTSHWKHNKENDEDVNMEGAEVVAHFWFVCSCTWWRLYILFSRQCRCFLLFVHCLVLKMFLISTFSIDATSCFEYTQSPPSQPPAPRRSFSVLNLKHVLVYPLKKFWDPVFQGQFLLWRHAPTVIMKEKYIYFSSKSLQLTSFQLSFHVMPSLYFFPAYLFSLHHSPSLSESHHISYILPFLHSQN